MRVLYIYDGKRRQCANCFQYIENENVVIVSASDTVIVLCMKDAELLLEKLASLFKRRAGEGA